MIDLLNNILPEVLNEIRRFLYGSSSGWNSLVINKRKPHTVRAYKMFGDNRVCLHSFQPCKEEDVFSHPHPWPAAFLMLKGEYIHKIGCSNTLKGEPQFIYTEIVRPYSMYEISIPFTWHCVQPLDVTYTIMLNGPEFENKHEQTRTTKGKDLDKLSDSELAEHLTVFDNLLTLYLERS